MRHIVRTKINIDIATRLMINETQDGVFVFGYDTLIDGYSNWDNLYNNVEEFKEFAVKEFGVTENDWIQIDSEIEGCQQD